MRNLLYSFIIMSLGLLPGLSLAVSNSQEAVAYMQKHWAVDNYQLQGKSQDEAFIKLVGDADGFVEQFPADASVLIWRGIIKSTYAGVKGGLGALKYAKSSRSDLERALELEPEALNGSAYTSLGTLYFNVPGWPIGFGDNKKAQSLLQKALAINPDGIDPNYFYADYLINKKRFTEAKEHLQRALGAAPRPGRELADQGRKKEILAALAEVEKHL